MLRAAPGQTPIDTVAMLTTAANSLFSDIHDRMPVIVDPADYDLWMGRHVHKVWALEGVT
jgi:putative SOS response-associated peptidase YedK